MPPIEIPNDCPYCGADIVKRDNDDPTPLYIARWYWCGTNGELTVRGYKCYERAQDE